MHRVWEAGALATCACRRATEGEKVSLGPIASQLASQGAQVHLVLTWGWTRLRWSRAKPR